MADNYRDLLLHALPGNGARPLRSPFTEVWGKECTGPRSLRSGRLTIDKDGVLPNDKGAAAGANKWTEEQGLVNQLPAGDPQDYTLFQLARVYGSRQASAVNEVVSQFDVNRLAAARTVCDVQSSTGEYLFLKGGISGIQRFIYEGIKAEQIGDATKVAKLLRGRSALVSMLGDLIADFLVRKLGLEQANVLFVGGGHFNLLLPASAENAVAEAFWKINEKLLADYDLKLHLVRGEVTITEKDFADFGSVFTQVNDRMEADKQRRYAGHLHEKIVFQHRLISSGRSTEKFGDEEIIVERRTQQRDKALATFGGQLAKADYVLEIAGRNPKNIADALALKKGFSIGAITTSVYPLSQADWAQLVPLLQGVKTDGHILRLQRLNSTDFLPALALQKQLATAPVGYGFRLIGSTAPIYQKKTADHKQGDIMELTDLAQLNLAGKEAGLPYAILSALRLDIDDLGALFAHGLGKTASLERTLGLSRELQLFFGGYFHQLAAKHHLYVVYAGGDDAFVLGSWLNVIHFLRALRAEFKQFTAGNKAVSFSAGVFNSHPKYPIARLHADAAIREGWAKKYSDEPGELAKLSELEQQVRVKKDAVCLFDRTVDWDRFEELLTFASKLHHDVAPGNKSASGSGHPINRSVLQTLLRVITEAEEMRRKEQGDRSEKNAAAEFEFYRNLGRLHGLLTRRGAIKNTLVRQLLRETETDSYDKFQDYLIPLNYVLHATRSTAN